MVKKKSKKIRVFIIVLVLFIGLVGSSTALWYFWIRIPESYGHFYDSFDPNDSNISYFSLPSRLTFNGKNYKNISNTKLGRSITSGNRALGQIKIDNGATVDLYSVAEHPDLLIIFNEAEMSWVSQVFQEEER